MIRIFFAAIISINAMVICAQQESASTQQDIYAKIEKMRSQWSDKVADELAKLPDDIQNKIEDAQNKLNAVEKQIQALNNDSLTPQQLQVKIKEIIVLKKSEADARIKIALQKIDDYKAGHKAELDRAQQDIRKRIDSKKAELEEKRAEIEKKIASKKAEIEKIAP
ncbi:MAG TPA: hypothetical protein VHP36_10540 [Chitinispirillaceae bacterium]|nr:hypothetical protein [Chitinispirillaceae bacterium]